MSISEKMRLFAEKSSWIRKMFEEGAKMKAQYGAENVLTSASVTLTHPHLIGIIL